MTTKWAQEKIEGGRICECDHRIEDDDNGESWFVSDGCTGHHWARWSMVTPEDVNAHEEE